MSLGTFKVALVTDPAEIIRRFRSILIFGQGMDLNTYLSLRGTVNKGYNANISCYANVAFYTEIKLKGGKDILVKGKEREREATHLEMGKGNLP